MAGKTINDLTSITATDVSQADKLMVWNTEDGTTRKMPVSEMQKAGILAGYSFQNSWYFENGRTHAGNPDALLEAEDDVNHNILFTCDTSGDFENRLPVGMPEPYDRSTGLITLNQFQEQDFIQFRFQVDCVPETDGGTMVLSLEVERHNKSPFTIEDTMISMDDGADLEYNALSTIPIFIGSMYDDGTGNPATIRPRIRLVNTDGDILPRSFVMYAWR